MSVLTRENDDNSMTESWMDYSIRMRLRNNNDVDDDMDYDEGDDGSSSAYIAMAVPPSNSGDENQNQDQNHQCVSISIPIAFAEPIQNSRNWGEPALTTDISSYPTHLIENLTPAPDAETTTRISTQAGEVDENSCVQNDEAHNPQTSISNTSVGNTSSETSSGRTQRIASQDSSSDENIGEGNSNNQNRRERNEVRMVRRTGLDCFGRRRNNFRTSSVSRFIIPRTSLPYTIEHDTATMKWMAIIHTDQVLVDRGSENISLEDMDNMVILKFDSIQEAREACHVYAPPRMHSFEDYKRCHICRKKFHRVLQRPSNCQNCGICVCSSCSILWPASMIPITYQLKKSRKSVKVCVACDWLNDTFRMSLIDGNLDKAVALYHTGNVNLRCPFAKGKNEIYYPVHCAIIGGELSILRWLVDTHCCPINYYEKYSKNDKKQGRIGKEAIITSKGRSVLTIAMESESLTIQRYLVVEKRMNIFHCTNLKLALKNLASCLHTLPEPSGQHD